MPEKKNINKELEPLRQKAQARGITEEDVENEIKAHRARKIQVPADLQEICFIFEDSSCEHRSYLDLKTGEIIRIFDDIMDADEKEELDDKVDEGLGERYITIPNADSHEGYQDMEDFIETVKDMKLKEKLYNSIARKGAFRRFKDVLNSYPKERERWFKFKDEKIMERVNEWLDEEGIEIHWSSVKECDRFYLYRFINNF